MITAEQIANRFKIESRIMKLMLYTLFCLILADGVLTEFLVTNGYGIEANPLLRTLVDQNTLIPIKALGAFFVTLFLWFRYNSSPRIVHTVTVGAMICYTAIVYWNIVVFLVSL